MIFVCLLKTTVLYYWTLLFPTVSGAAILLIAAMLGSYGGLICCLLFPWLAKSIFLQYHRMTTHLRFDKYYVINIQQKICFFITICVFFSGYLTLSTWGHLWLGCSIHCSASMENSCLISWLKNQRKSFTLQLFHHTYYHLPMTRLWFNFTTVYTKLQSATSCFFPNQFHYQKCIDIYLYLWFASLTLLNVCGPTVLCCT